MFKQVILFHAVLYCVIKLRKNRNRNFYQKCVSFYIWYSDVPIIAELANKKLEKSRVNSWMKEGNFELNVVLSDY